MNRFIALLLIVFSISTSYGQSLSITSTESRCQNTGTIGITISGGTPTYSFQIYDGPSGANAQSYPVTQVSGDSTHTFNDLIPGKYYVRVIDQNITLIDSIEVGGSYSIPLFTLGGYDITCPSVNDGKIFIESKSNGRGPFSYQIVSPYTSPTQTTDTFSGLAVGTYQVRMFDSCGNYQTRSYTLGTNYQTFGWYLIERGRRLSCDSFELTFRGYQGITPYTFHVINPNNTSDTLASQIAYNTNDTVTFNLPIYLSGPPTYTEYIIVGVDGCGESVDDTRRFDSWYYPNNDIGCDSTDVYFGGPQFNLKMRLL